MSKQLKLLATIFLTIMGIGVVGSLVYAAEPSRTGIYAPSAAPIVVNDGGDASDASPGDGTCATSGGVCTLRAAIEEANASAGPDHISFSNDFSIVIGTNLATIDEALTIDGIGHSVSITSTGGIYQFRLSANQSLTLTNLTLGYTGFNISNHAAVEAENGGALTLDTVLVENNTYRDFGYFFARRGTGTSLTVNVVNSTFRNNRATNWGAGGFTVRNGTLNVIDSTFENNQGSNAYAGAMELQESVTGTISNTHFYNNTSPNENGGAINHSNGALTINQCTFQGNSANSASGAGGAIYSQTRNKRVC